MKPKGPNRRFSHRLVVPAVLVAGLLLPFVFIRAAFLALDARAASICPSISTLLSPPVFPCFLSLLPSPLPIGLLQMLTVMSGMDSGCLGWTLRPRLLLDSSQDFGKELRRVYLEEAEEGGHNKLDPRLVNAAPDSLDDLMSEMSSSSSYQHLDLRTLLLKTKAMLLKMDQKVQSARLRALIFQHLASTGIPKSMHCLSLRLAEQYLVNAAARSSLPPPEYASCLTDNSYIHIALITDNILAAAVMVSSTMTSAADPEKVVFHIITDKKTYTSMHAWFAIHPVFPAILEVRGLHQFDFPPDVNAVIMDTVEELHRSSSAYRYYRGADEESRRLLALKPSTFSLLNYMRIHLPELFPKLERVIFMHDDVVVQRDLTSLWYLDLHGLVMGAVSAQESDDEGSGDGLCLGKTFGDYINFSNPMLTTSPSSYINVHGWRASTSLICKHGESTTSPGNTSSGLNWQALRNPKLNRESGFALWPMGSLPPALLAFHGQVLPLNRSWLLSGLGWQMPDPELLQSAAVIHFSGPGKPWLETGHPELRKIWQSQLNHSDELVSSCMVV
ncbi:Glycosyl transferase family 8 [Musa troglodytarum]|uniref:Hexosyltransferase n=1 Tax=Musa troglodytarum TaxID=320322 RepID=A0A9E7HQK4_9LILI|nr:Glycosyl transferase family 8 [Musa troglodytarum]